ncbi:hypothetical protein DM2_1925 [Halorubrum sp. DM2]|nr:hypothetical protein DM2_1925 [Halorubrum sp. DM2]
MPTRRARPRSPDSTPQTADERDAPRTEATTPTRPPTDGERDAPLVPDLRPASRTQTDGGSR